MAWHSRYIKPDDPKMPSGGLRTTVVFTRRDYLWKSSLPITNPYTNEVMERIPMPLSGTGYCGPNILDVCQLAKVKEPNPKSPKEKIFVRRWQLRSTDEYFENPKKLKKADSDRTLRHYPFRSSLATSGSFYDEDDDFVIVEKKSSISISRLVFLIAVRIHGNSRTEAARAIGELACQAWDQDLVRAKRLFNLIKSEKDGILDVDVDDEYRAKSAISQEVESFILREACQLLSVDPDEGFQRRRGRPKGTGRSGGETSNADDMSSQGDVIRLELSEDGTVQGLFIVDFGGIKAQTKLSALTTTKLALIMAALSEDGLEHDAELLEAYLEAVDENWRVEVASVLGAKDEQTQSDPYQVLGVAVGSTFAEVKQAYRRIINVVHPDKNDLPDYYSHVVQEAYDTLKREFNNEQE